MSRLRNFLIPFSLAAGAIAFLTAWWLRQGRVNRSGLASNTAELTWQALRQLATVEPAGPLAGSERDEQAPHTSPAPRLALNFRRPTPLTAAQVKRFATAVARSI